MARYALSTNDLDLVALLCREAAELGRHTKWKRFIDLQEWTEDDFQRAQAIADKLDTPEPRTYVVGTAYEPPPSYTPPGGRL